MGGLPFFSLAILASLVLQGESVPSQSGTGPLRVLGYIVDVQVNCPMTEAMNGYVTVTAERPLFAEALCSNGKRNFTRIDAAHQRLIISPRAGDNDPILCSLPVMRHSRTYVVTIQGGWGEEGNEIMVPELTRNVFCSYDNHTLAEKKTEIQMKAAVIAPRVMENYMGPMHNSRPVILEAVNIFEQPIDGKDFQLGRLIRLRAKPRENFTIKAISCYAANSAGKRYYTIRAGCGDGIVFKKSVGFHLSNATTTTTTVYSPYFEAFKLPGADDIHFQCRFLVCKYRTCALDSCEYERRKRDVYSDSQQAQEIVTTVSGYVIMRDPKIKRRLQTIEVLQNYHDLTNDSRDRFEMAHNSVKLITALGVIGAMLLVTIVTLMFVCYRQSTIAMSPPPITTNIPEKNGLNNLNA